VADVVKMSVLVATQQLVATTKKLATDKVSLSK
jgi:hypothetical protein